MALTFGAYAAPAWQRPLAVAAVVALTAVNYLGVRKTALAHAVIVGVVLAALALVVAGAGARRDRDALTTSAPRQPRASTGSCSPPGCCSSPSPATPASRRSARRSSDPARTIPRAIPLALGITLVVYAVVAVSALAAVGPDALARLDAPLATAVQRRPSRRARARSCASAAPSPRSVSCCRCIAGVSRTAFAMAADRELPRWLDAVHPRHTSRTAPSSPSAWLVALLVAVTDLRGAIGFSSFCVLAYYAIANASAWTLPPAQRRWPRALAAAGLVGCATLAFTLPVSAVVAGTGVLSLGALVCGRSTQGRGVFGEPVVTVNDTPLAMTA